MLVLSRKKNESILIGENILVHVVEIRGKTVRLGFTAPDQIPVHRMDLILRSPELCELHGLRFAS